MRQEYLFDFAHVCHISPTEIDRMRLLDFYQLIVGIDAYRAEIKRINESNSQ
jgi:hypothetical protein